MKYLLISILFFVFSGTQAQLKLDSTRSFEQNFYDKYHPWMRFGSFIPQNIDECMIVLKSEPQYSRMLVYNEEEIYELLFDKGRYTLHQSWDLKAHSVLAQYFYNRGVYSVAKMEATILYCYYKLEMDCGSNFDEVIAQTAKKYKKSEKLTYKLLTKELKSELRLHRKIKRKSKKEYRKAIKMAKKGDEFDLFYD